MAASLAGCTVAGGERDVTETAERSYDAADVSRLSVDVDVGDVEISGEDRDGVDVRAVKAAAGENDLDSVELVEERTDGALSLTVEHEESVFRLGPRPKMDLEIAVPASFEAVEIDATSGRVAVRAVEGDATVDATNGDVEIADVGGDVTVDGTNGRVEASGIGGDLTAEMTNGDLSVSEFEGGLDLDLTNGNVTITAPEGLDATADIQSSNGEITVDKSNGRITTESEYEATFRDGTNRINVTTSNGDVELRIGE